MGLWNVHKGTRLQAQTINFIGRTVASQDTVRGGLGWLVITLLISLAKFLEESFGPLDGADVYFARIVTRQGTVAAIDLRMAGALIVSIPPS